MSGNGSMTIEDELNQISMTDQAEQGIINLARLTAKFYKELMGQEVPADDALELSCQFLSQVIEDTFNAEGHDI